MQFDHPTVQRVDEPPWRRHEDVCAMRQLAHLHLQVAATCECNTAQVRITSEFLSLRINLLRKFARRNEDEARWACRADQRRSGRSRWHPYDPVQRQELAVDEVGGLFELNPHEFAAHALDAAQDRFFAFGTISTLEVRRHHRTRDEPGNLVQGQQYRQKERRGLARACDGRSQDVAAFCEQRQGALLHWRQVPKLSAREVGL
mmetsp:Transcript_119526/g.338263  ORF Transcript_119526/g.338263 Transcript_119526/m.338263 type:complete len:203 (+) Transcript_119526:1230-1838(+)